MPVNIPSKTGAENRELSKSDAPVKMPGSGNGTRSNAEEKSGNAIRSIPDRYVIKEDDDFRTLSCYESPNITLRLDRSIVVAASQARKASGTIFLDGAAQGAPFLEHERQVYNLDHHEGCIRSFTLATCEQAMIVLMKGLDLRKQEWRIVANEPDLDTIMAIWVLMNHLRLSGTRARVRKSMIPILRLEGMIDAHGLEFTEFCGFPDDLLNRSMRIIENLRQEEIRLKTQGLWETADLLEYTAAMLRKMDQIMYRPSELMGLKEIEEFTQIVIHQNRIAVACRSDAGIYETEQQLKKIYGSRLALIVLQKNESGYTIRQTDLFLPGNLDDIYERLNIYDPVVSGRRPENRWGGATDIGGSPRQSGTKLAPREILEVVAEVFRKPSFWNYAAKAARAVAVVSAVILTAWMAYLYELPVLLWRQASLWKSGPLVADASNALHTAPLYLQSPGIGFLIGIMIAVAIGLSWAYYRNPRIRLYGLDLPSGWDWLPLVLPAILVGCIGAAWTPWIPPENRTLGVGLVHLLFYPAAAELLFRSLIHGLLIPGSRIQTRGSLWFLSYPTFLSSLLYAMVMLLPYNPFISLPVSYFPYYYPAIALKAVLAFVFALILGTIRERSESLIMPYAAHLAAAAGAFAIFQIYI